MNPTPSFAIRSPAPAVALLLLAILLTGCFRPSSETRRLSTALLETLGDDWQTNIELGAGALTFGLARVGSRWLDLPPEARTVLRSVRRADVGVYTYRGPGRPGPGIELLRAADQSLAKQGWERTVTVLEGGNTVALYVPEDLEEDGPLPACLIVMDGSELVLVRVRGNPEPIVSLALEQARLGKHRLASVR